MRVADVGVDVSMVTALDGFEGIAEFFEGCLVEQSPER